MLHLQKIEDSDDDENVGITIFKGKIPRNLDRGMIPEAKLRKRLYKYPDIALIVNRKALHILKSDMESLIDKGGVYYEVFDRLLDKKKETCIVVIFFDDSMLDLMAETTKLKARMIDYDCRVEFKAFARDQFKRFSGREVYEIIDNLLEREIDLNCLMRSKVVLDKIYLHNRNT